MTYQPTPEEIDALVQQRIAGAKAMHMDGRVLRQVPDRDLYELRIGVYYYTAIQLSGELLSRPDAKQRVEFEVDGAVHDMVDYIKTDIKEKK